MKQAGDSARVLWMDNLRVCATVAVVLLHVSAKVMTEDKVVSGWQWITGNAFGSVVRFSVPAFLMITGALLLPREYEPKDFLTKRMVRIILPFLFWTVVYIVFNLCVDSWAPHLGILQGDYRSVLTVLKWAFFQLLQGASFHLWYVYMLIGVYLFIPIIGKWLRSCSNKEISYFLGIWALTLVFNLPHIVKFKPAVDLTYFSGYLGYVVLGYYLTRITPQQKGKITGLSVVLIFCGIMVTFLGTFFYSLRSGAFDSTFYKYLSPHVAIVTVGIFLLFKANASTNNSKRIMLRDSICKYSYGIYLVHPLVLYFLNKASINWQLFNPFAGILLTTIIGALISTLVIYIINKLPYGKYISG